MQFAFSSTNYLCQPRSLSPTALRPRYCVVSVHQHCAANKSHSKSVSQQHRAAEINICRS